MGRTGGAGRRSEDCYDFQTIGRRVRSKELAGFLKARDGGRPPCKSVRAAGERLLREMDEQLTRLREARTVMAETLAEWDARLERTPEGTPAHLLTMIPPGKEFEIYSHAFLTRVKSPNPR
jgi:hypothetical protein